MMSEYEEADESNENEDSFVGQHRDHLSGKPRYGDEQDNEEASQSDRGDPEYKDDYSGDDNYNDEVGAAGYENGTRYHTVESRDCQEASEEWVVEEEEEDDNGGDDPQDADFDPVSPENNFSQQEDDDDDYNASADEQEEAGSAGGFDISSDDEIVRPANPRKRPAVKISHARVVPTSQKRHRVAQRKDYPSDDDDDSDGDHHRNHRKSVGLSTIRPRAPVVIASNQRASGDFSSRETRSRRGAPRKSYAEEESEEDEDQKPKKKTSDELEEEDSDKIERVVWHQPKGIAEAEILEGRKAEPSILDSDPADMDWEEQEFYIKWKGQSYLHCQWQTLVELRQLSGFKKVVNYMKKVDEERQKRRNLSSEEAEVHDLSKEMELDLLKQYTQVERVFAERINTGDEEEYQEYLVKWKGLSYAESTWEKDIDLVFAQDFIDEYKERESACTFQGKSVDFQRKRAKMILRKLEAQPEWLKGGKLRDYQLDGLNFMVNGWRMNTNVILADEMGLGKTVQSLSMLGYLLYNLEIVGPFLIVVPLSTIANWAKEFRKWLPSMNVVIYVGNVASREMCQKYEFYINGRPKFNTLITTYELVLKDKDILSQFKWDFMMVDEAHRLKNNEAALYTELMRFSAKNKVLVTGTPLQNNVEELWALLHFLDPIKFRNKDDYKNLVSFNETELERLHSELRPHLLRRVIKDVEKSLPPKIERILRVEMSPLQKQYYKWILERNFSDLNKGVRGNQVSLLNIVVELKKCCNHPFLFESADHGYGANANMNDNSRVQRVVLSSGKLVLLDKLLVRLKETGHRVLIFSQMVKMLDILADYLQMRGFQFQRLDGSTKHQQRQQAMEHFNAPGSDDFCFLLSTRAGGLGINLATADTVIIFDSDWNPQNDLQAMSRAHRIGQEFVVNIYRFVTSRSVEEDILERAKKKMVLDHLVIQKLNAQGRIEMTKEKPPKMFDKNELAAILKFGAEELFREDKKTEEEASSKLENMDIDEILERAEKVSGDTEQPGGELLSAFKVANFSQGEDDAAFWSRLIPAETAKEAPDLGPRAARKIRTYAEDAATDRYSKRRKNSEEVGRKRSTRVSRAPEPPPRVDGATAHVYDWEGTSLSKRDANAFVKGVKKFGDKSRIDMIVVNTGSIENASEDSQLELMEALVDGCTEAVDNSHNPKAAILDFFGVTVKAQELLTRVKELTQLGKRIRRYQNPVSQFRLRSHSKPPSAVWAKWTQVDDARLLLGVFYHGYGNWEKIRTDDRLMLNNKIAPTGATAAETSLPRASNLDLRVSTLLKKEMELDKGANGETSKGRSKRNQAHESSSKVRQTKERVSASRPSGTRKSARNINRENAAAAAAAREAAAEDKEEGEISDDGSVQRRQQKVCDDKEREQRWHNWCEGVLKGEMRTLKRLQNLQSAHSESNEKVVIRVKKYLQKLGDKIDSILDENKGEKCNPQKMATRLWNYVAGFSDLSGHQLSTIYVKLREQPETAAAAAAENNGSSRDRNETLTYKRRHGRKEQAESSSKKRRKAAVADDEGFYGKGESP